MIPLTMVQVRAKALGSLCQELSLQKAIAPFCWRKKKMVQVLLPYLQTFLAIGNLCIMLWALKTFLNKPQSTLNEKLTDLENKVARQDLVIEEMKRSLDNSHEKHREQKQTNEMFITCMLAFIDFEIAFCQYTKYEHSEDLIKAKETLQKYLAQK